MSNPTIQIRECELQLEPMDAQRIAEVSLGLRNLSFTITEFLSGRQDGDFDNLPGALFALHRQAMQLSAQLDEISGCSPSASLTGEALDAVSKTGA